MTATGTLWEASWTVPAGAVYDEFMIYIREKGARDWDKIGSTRATSFRFDSLPRTGTYQIGIAPLRFNVEAAEKSWAILDFSPGATVSSDVPDNVSNLTVGTSGNDVKISWDEVDHPDISCYEVRFGTAWDTSVHEVKASGTSALLGVRRTGVNTWLVKAKTSKGKLSATAASATYTVPSNDYEPTQGIVTEAGTWGGTLSGTETSGSDLQLASVPATASDWTDFADTYTRPVMLPHSGTGTYITATVDVGSVVDERIEVALTPAMVSATTHAAEWTGLVSPTVDGSGNADQPGTLHTFDRVFADGDLVDGIDVKVEIDTAQDATPTWDGWRRWIPGATYKYRQVRLRLTLNSVWFNRVKITTFTWRRRRINRKDETTVTIAGTGGTAVVFTTGFTAAPKVSAQVIGTTAVFATVDTVTASGCNVRAYAYDGAEQSSATVHILALGV